MNNAGFTLMELLVVVLIIGVLAAVAVPQYEKAVKKSRASEALMWAKRVEAAEEAYYMANGKYTRCLNDLDLDLGMFPTQQEAVPGCVSTVSKGKNGRPSFLTIIMQESIYYGNPYGGPSHWVASVFIGNYAYSGWGGYGFWMAHSESLRQPLSCIEYSTHMCREGSFCREVMGLKRIGNTRRYN